MSIPTGRVFFSLHLDTMWTHTWVKYEASIELIGSIGLIVDRVDLSVHHITKGGRHWFQLFSIIFCVVLAYLLFFCSDTFNGVLDSHTDKINLFTKNLHFQFLTNISLKLSFFIYCELKYLNIKKKFCCFLVRKSTKRNIKLIT